MYFWSSLYVLNEKQITNPNTFSLQYKVNWHSFQQYSLFIAVSQTFLWKKAFVRLIAPNPVYRAPTDVHEHLAHPQTMRQWLLTRSLSHSENALHVNHLHKKATFLHFLCFSPSQTNLWLESRFSNFSESSAGFFSLSAFIF